MEDNIATEKLKQTENTEKVERSIYPYVHKKEALLRYEPIELNGLVYYPIKVADLDKWQALKPVLCMRQGTLPAVYACMTYLQCVWALDYSAKSNIGEGQDGIWNALLSVLFLSLRLSEGDEIQAIGDPAFPQTITNIRIVKDGQETDITPMEFMKIRKLIAEQNGAELPDEADNPDLIEAANDTQSADTLNIDYSDADYLTSVASAKGLRRKDLFDWPIKELEDEAKALRRRYGYFLASIAESQGAKFKNGNPYPTWMFDKRKDEFAGLISLNDLQAEHHAQINESDTAPTQNT